MVEVKMMVLRPWCKPVRASDGAAGFDLVAATTKPTHIPLGKVVRIPCGVAFEIPPGYEGQIRPRSSMGERGLVIANAPGTIDSDYRGEVCVLLRSVVPCFVISPGDRIAQIVFQKVPDTYLVEVDELTPTERGSGGFGSTGR